MASSIAAPDEESTGEETTSEESEVVILDSDHRKQLKAINKMAGRTMGVRLARTQSLPEPVVSVSPPHRPTFIGGLTPRTLEDEVTKGRPFLKNSAAEEGEERSSLLTHAKGRMTGKRKTIDQDLSAQSEPRMKRASKEKSRPTVVRKSKRTAKIVQVLPEEQQLFRGLSFCEGSIQERLVIPRAHPAQSSCPTMMLALYGECAFTRPSSMAPHGSGNSKTASPTSSPIDV